MEVVAVISIFVTGVLCGLIGLDFKSRVVLKQELATTLAKIQGVHNELTQAVAGLVGRVETLEMKLSGFKK